MEDKPIKKYAGKLPVNSRITVNYEGKEPKVKFSYPDKKKISSQAGDPLTAIICLVIWTGICFLIFQSFILLLNNKSEYVSYPTDCEVLNGRINGTFYSSILNQNLNYDYITNITIQCNNLNQTFLINPGYKNNNKYIDYIRYVLSSYSRSFSINKQYIYNDLLFLFLLAIVTAILVIYAGLMVGYLVFYRLIISILIKTKWYKEKMPYINKKMSGRGYYIKFNKAENKIIEIPLFKNVYLDYNAIGDFSKYLTKVEIREHPFTKMMLKIGKHGRLRKLKKRKNISLWYARFYFKEVPKGGYLEVKFN